MRHNDDSMFPWSEASPAYFPDCPRLQYFDAEPLFFRPTTALPRLASLTIAIATTGVSFDVVWGILRLTPHLSALHVSFGHVDIVHTLPPTPPIALPNVACLTVYGYNDTFYAWAAGISLPGVSTLRCGTTFSVQPAHPFFANITAVVIDSDTETCPISADRPQELRQLVQLRTLTIRHSDSIQGSFFRAARSPNECWKDLSSIVFDDAGLTDDAARELIEFLRTREAHGPSPLSMHIGSCDIPSWLEVELRRILGDRCYIHPQTSHPFDSSDTESDDSNQHENDE
ncbi:hypothetical protein EXIGLDRAFT_780867 [Exidia glandulosa HHB12029]|uniref:F-box domain-containing protein n=1 Tax=Exidia glandulosa HHB12029 TaxID=1314781 RepID=A0A165BF53_EXIGL|nr:hypothetical protein EXIGLDRAFT_780867 [Exidia glandulosa HHB12029]